MNQNRNLNLQTHLDGGSTSFLSTAVTEFSNVLTGVWDTITGRTFKKTKALRVEQLLHQEGIKRIAVEVNDVNEQISKIKSDMRKMKNLFDSSNQFMEAASVQINKINKLETILEDSANIENLNMIINNYTTTLTKIEELEYKFNHENSKFDKNIQEVKSNHNETNRQIKFVKNELDLKDKYNLKTTNLLKAEIKSVSNQADKIKSSFTSLSDCINEQNDIIEINKESVNKNFKSTSLEIEELQTTNKEIMKQSSLDKIEITDSLEKLKGQNKILIYFIALIIVIELLSRFNVLNKFL